MARIDIDTAAHITVSPGGLDELTPIAVAAATRSVEISALDAGIALTWQHIKRDPVAVPVEGATVAVPSQLGFEVKGATFNLSGPMGTAATITPKG